MNDDPATSGAPENDPGVDRRLLELLVCPLTKTSLDYVAERQELVSRVARLAFPIRDGVPMMTVEAARKLDDDEAVHK
jgi:uncharacterized protein YbaR (Trm112 family)